MPAGTPYDSFVAPYPIRVDDFTNLKPPIQTIPALYLLTHTHSDHTTGLNAKSFGSTIICSEDAKEMLLRHESYRARHLVETAVQVEKVRTYSHLKSSIRMQSGGQILHIENRDLLRPLPLHTPTRFELSNHEWVTITLFDANHCPGAVMFLMEGSKGTILHTGDFRAESTFLSSLARNPFIQRYIAPTVPSSDKHALPDSPVETLEAIYLDTASLLTTFSVPAKEDATSGLVQLMTLFPQDTKFFINSWTWGYEEILKAIAHAFRSKIHVDRYKHDVYTHLSDPFLTALVTKDSSSTRFHACERFDRCKDVSKDDSTVVYVNPVKMTIKQWETYQHETKATLEVGGPVTHLLVPLSRHSSLPELQAFVSLLKPKRLVPNFLEPKLRGLDWACMPKMFGDCMAEGGVDALREEVRLAGIGNNLESLDEDETIEEHDAIVSNLEGSSSGMNNNSHDALTQLVERWTSEHGTSEGSGRGRTSGKIRQMQAFLPHGMTLLVERAVRDSRKKKMPAYYESDEEETQSDDRGITAHRLFANWRPSVTPTSSPKGLPAGKNGFSNAAASLATPLSSPFAMKAPIVEPQAMQSTPKMKGDPPLHNSLAFSLAAMSPTINVAIPSQILLPYPRLPAFFPSVRSPVISLTTSAKVTGRAKPITSGDQEQMDPELGSPIMLKTPERKLECSTPAGSSKGNNSQLPPFLDLNNLDRQAARSASTRKCARNLPPSHSHDRTPSMDDHNDNEGSRSNHSIQTMSSAVRHVKPVTPKRRRLSVVDNPHLPPLGSDTHGKAPCSQNVPKTKARRQKPLLSPKSKRVRKQERSKQKVESLELSRKLSIARPDLAITTSTTMSASRFRKSNETGTTLGIADLRDKFDTVELGSIHSTLDPNDTEMDWDRSRELERMILEDLRQGRRPRLPPTSYTSFMDLV